MSSKLLINEPPLQVLPTLAEKLSLNKAIALQQLQYWLYITQADRSKLKTHFFDGRWWVYNTYQFWQEDSFKWWGHHTVRRTFVSLEEDGLIERRPHQNNNLGYWHTINYDAVAALIGAGNELNPDLAEDDTPGQNGPGSDDDTSGQNGQGLEDTPGQNGQGSAQTPVQNGHHSETTVTETTETQTYRPDAQSDGGVGSGFDPQDQVTGPAKGQSEEPEKPGRKVLYDSEHPLAQELIEFNGNNPLPGKTIKELEKEIRIRLPDGTTANRPNIFYCYDNYPGFPDFVKARAKEFKAAGFNDVHALSQNLRNFGKDGDRFYGWLKWAEVNSRIINQDTSKPEPEPQPEQWIGDD